MEAHSNANVILVQPPGVWFTEEGLTAEEDIGAVLGLASVEAHTVEADGTIGISGQEIWGAKQIVQKIPIRD